jgi:pyruvate kinase
MGDADNLRSLTAELTDLRREMMRKEASLEGRMDEICDSHRESARNLVHYIALRQHDVRHLQEKLTEDGLSSLGRCEADVLGAIDAVLRVLHRITGKAGPQPPSPSRSKLLFAAGSC